MTEQLLDSVCCGDFDVYSRLCDANITCFDPNSLGNLIEGIQFHKFYFDNLLIKNSKSYNTTMINPHVHLLNDDSAVICYVRLTQFIDK